MKDQFVYVYVDCVWRLCDGITFVDKLISNVVDKGNIVIQLCLAILLTLF